MFTGPRGESNRKWHRFSEIAQFNLLTPSNLHRNLYSHSDTRCAGVDIHQYWLTVRIKVMGDIERPHQPRHSEPTTFRSEVLSGTIPIE